MNNISNEVKELRKNIFITAYHGRVGHLASAFSIAEIISVLYLKEILKYDVKNPNWRDRDRLIISKGHASLALYCILARVGYFDKKELHSFCKIGSLFGGEPHIGHVPGVEASTGSLGHGLSFATGIAMANKMDGIDSKVYVILGDGECQEGSVWEAVMSAKNFNLDNLVVILDDNKLQAMGSVNEIMGIESWKEKWSSFGWEVEEIDGHNVDEIYEALKKENPINKPKIIIANTIKGKGVSFMENVPIWHYRMPNQEELQIVMKELGITKEELGL